MSPELVSCEAKKRFTETNAKFSPSAYFTPPLMVKIEAQFNQGDFI